MPDRASLADPAASQFLKRSGECRVSRKGCACTQRDTAVSPLIHFPEILMRAQTARSTIVLTTLASFVTLVACSPDAAGDPLAPGFRPGPRTPAALPTRRRYRSAAPSSRTKRIPTTPRPTASSCISRARAWRPHCWFTVVDDGVAYLSTGLGEGRCHLHRGERRQLHRDRTGSAVIDGGFADVIDDATITGGTGRFAGATGTLTILKRVDIATGISSGSLKGTMNLPR